MQPTGASELGWFVLQAVPLSELVSFTPPWASLNGSLLHVAGWLAPVLDGSCYSHSQSLSHFILLANEFRPSPTEGRRPVVSVRRSTATSAIGWRRPAASAV